MSTRRQRTIANQVSFSGLGLHTGQEVTIHLSPASENAGVFFRRIDLPEKPEIAATIQNVQQTSRSTTIGVGEHCVHTVEHLLAAVSAFNIDNLCIEITAAESPISDGSSREFVTLLEQAGAVEQEAEQEVLRVTEPIYFSEGGIHLVALPAEEFRVSYTLHYPKVQKIGSQYFSMALSCTNFKEQLCSSRTFALYEEIEALKARGLIRGGSLENAVVIKDHVILNEGGLRYEDEMVRHKVLDVIGDLFLVGRPFFAHVIAICSGHRTNVKFGEKLMKHFSSYKGDCNG